MLRIAICSNDLTDLNNINSLISNLVKSLDLDFETQEFNTGNAVLQSTISFDLLFLCLENLTGIEIAQKIRLYDRDVKIVLVSNSQNYLRNGYAVKAEGYFIKPIDKTEFNRELTYILKSNIMDNKFILDKRIGPCKIYLKKIIYIEFFNRKTIVHMTNKNLTTNLTLKQWSALLEKYEFVHCHRAFIINLHQIKELRSKTILLANDAEINLSRKYKDEFKIKYYASIREKYSHTDE